MCETEITVQVFADLKTIFRQLKSLGFRQVREYGLHDWYFTSLPLTNQIDYPTLMQNSFLVRQVTGDETTAKLCYKDKTIDPNGNVTSEAKIAVPVSDLAGTLQIFQAARLNHWCELKQTLYVFRQGSTEFAVQDVADLGIFIEYEEDETMTGMTTQAKMDYMYAALQKLHLPLGSDRSCKKAYLKYLGAKTAKN